MLSSIADTLMDRKPTRLGEANGVVRYRLGYGATDAEQILHTLSTMMFEYGTDPEVRVFTTSRFHGFGHDDRSEQFKSVTNFMEDNVRYVRDPLGVEYVRSPSAMIREFKEYGMANGDCDDQVLFSGSMLFSIGFEVRPIGLNLFTDEYYDHVALQVLKDNGYWITYDPCRPSNPFMDAPPTLLEGEPASKFAQ